MITFLKYFPYDKSRIWADDCTMKLPTSLCKALRTELHLQRAQTMTSKRSDEDNKEGFLFLRMTKNAV